MLDLLRRAGRELTVERGRGRGRRSRSGIALLLVLTIIVLLTVLVTEVVHGAAIRLRLASNQRDEAKAEALAMGGVQFYRLLLIADKQLEGSGAYAMLDSYLSSMGMYAPINSNTLWQIVPKVSSSVMRMLLLTDNDEDEAREMGARGMTQDERDEADELGSRLHKPFLDFDGDFTAGVQDEDKRIFVGGLTATNMVELQSDPHAGMLASLMSGDKQDEYLRDQNIDKWELIGNLVDWTDQDDKRIYDGGSESQVYETIDEDEAPYRPKNAPFDTEEEIRLVDGWNKDQIWMRYGRHLTIYGSGKVNINTADRRVMEAVLQRFIQPPPTQDSMSLIWQQIQAFRNLSIFAEGGGGVFPDVGNFVGFLREIAPGTVDEGISQALTTKSTVFRITSEGEVGDAKVTIEAVFDFQRSPIGRVMYWRVQ
ncbi:MAG TPA: type II secretion system protein GspK [Myxococcota bacterium]|nr:type II secretion system protein GspK [Myxococcota bacterium]